MALTVANTPAYALSMIDRDSGNPDSDSLHSGDQELVTVNGETMTRAQLRTLVMGMVTLASDAHQARVEEQAGKYDAKIAAAAARLADAETRQD